MGERQSLKEREIEKMEICICRMARESVFKFCVNDIYDRAHLAFSGNQVHGILTTGKTLPNSNFSLWQRFIFMKLRKNVYTYNLRMLLSEVLLINFPI